MTERHTFSSIHMADTTEIHGLNLQMNSPELENFTYKHVLSFSVT